MRILFKLTYKDRQQILFAHLLYQRTEGCSANTETSQNDDRETGGCRSEPRWCPICQQPFVLRPNQIRKNNYCSRVCADKALVGRRLSVRTEFKRGQPSPKAMLGRKHSPETRRKMSGRVREKGPRWIADRTKLKTARVHMYDSRYKYWMKGIKNRDGWRCKISNGSCSGRLEAHHILCWAEYPKHRYQLSNGITLCHAHHPRKRAEEKRLAPLFAELVSVSKV